MRASRRRLRLLVFGASALGFSAHVAYHYLPRERAAVPRADDEPGRLAASWAEGWSLWLPYPHQNLGALARVEGAVEALGAAARLAGVGPLALPAFGPFTAPPARELAVAVDSRGERLAAAARVYPLIAGVARLGGRLAGNPWLAGGEVRWQGRSARVTWRGTLWRVETGEGRGAPSVPAADAARQPEVGGAPALALLRLSSAPQPFPAGLYRLERRGSTLQLTHGHLQPDLPGWPPAPGAALQVVTGGPAFGAAGPGAFFLWPEAGGGLGGVAVVHGQEGASWRLPGGKLLALTGNDHRSVEGDWTLEALDSESLSRARAATVQIGELLSGGLALGVWLAPAPALGAVRRIRGAIEAFPLAGRDERQFWGDLEHLLAPLVRFEEVVLGVEDQGRGVALRLTSEAPPRI